MSVGIIGCGYVFDHYMATWAKHSGLVLRGVTDIDRTRAEAVGRFYDLRVYASTDELLADPDIDIIANLPSIESHHEVTVAALEAG